MRTHSQIVSDIGEDRLATLGGVPLNTTSSWKRRDRIPSDMWQLLAAEKLATLEELASYAFKNRRARPSDVAAA